VVVSGVDLHTGCEGGPVGPSFVIERLEFQRGDVWYARHFRGLVTFLVGHSKAGKSTALEALLYPSGLLTATVMPEVRSCAYVRLVFRIAGTRRQATRSGSSPRARVSLKNLDDQDEIEHLLPVTSTKPGETTAGAFVQDLLGLPAAVRGATRVGLDDFYATVIALRQNTIASEFLGGGKDEARILALEVLLGLWNEDLAGLEKNASEATSRYRAARSALAAFKKLRDSGALADPASVRAMYEQKQREHHAATERWQQADAALKTAIGEGGRLVALHKAAELERRRTAKQVVAAHGRLNGATAEHARTEGRLAELLKPPGAGLHVLRAAAPGAGAGPVPAMRAAARGRGRPA
jgi:DNA repair exonuclease SbcCD ATPase subunit